MAVVLLGMAVFLMWRGWEGTGTGGGRAEGKGHRGPLVRALASAAVTQSPMPGKKPRPRWKEGPLPADAVALLAALEGGEIITSSWQLDSVAANLMGLSDDERHRLGATLLFAHHQLIQADMDNKETLESGPGKVVVRVKPHPSRLRSSLEDSVHEILDAKHPVAADMICSLVTARGDREFAGFGADEVRLEVVRKNAADGNESYRITRNVISDANLPSVIDISVERFGNSSSGSESVTLSEWMTGPGIPMQFRHLVSAVP